MSEQKEMLADAVIRLFRDAGEAAAAAEKRGWQQALWSQVEELGLPLVLVAESAGGVGGDWEDAGVVLQAAGLYAIPLPVGEAMLAARLAADARLELAPGAASIAVEVHGALTRDADGLRFSGYLANVPWGRDVRSIVTVLPHESKTHVVVLARSEAISVIEAVNTASEPRDTLEFRNAPVLAAPSSAPEAAALQDYAALLRVAQTLGALEGALHRSIDYARERKQFGRAIGQFQAVQQQLAQCSVQKCAVASTNISRPKGSKMTASKLPLTIAGDELSPMIGGFLSKRLLTPTRISTFEDS